jgi:DNA repair exonuclease SbcCD ATPase subunit
MKTLTFRECKKYIEALKKQTIFSDIKGSEARKILEPEPLQQKALLANNKKQQTICAATEEGFLCFYFEDEMLTHKDILASLDTYYQDLYACSLWQIDVELLLLFLNPEQSNLVTLHENVDFQSAFAEKQTFLAKSETESVLFYWTAGPMLLCTKAGGEETFYLSDVKDVICGDDALQKAESLVGDFPCAMKVLYKTEQPQVAMPEAWEEDILVAAISPSLDKVAAKPQSKAEKISSTVKRSKPDVQPQQSSGKERKLTKAIAKLVQDGANKSAAKTAQEEARPPKLEESVVVREGELPSIGPNDADVLKKYGIEAMANEDASQQARTKLVLAKDTDMPLDETMALTDKEMQILRNYGIGTASKETTPRKVREAFEESVILKQDDLPPVRPEDVSILKKYGIVLATPEQAAAAPILTAHEVSVLQKYGIKLAQGEKATLPEIQQAYYLALARKKFTATVALQDRAVFKKFGLKLPFFQRVPVQYVVIPSLVLAMIVLGAITGSVYKARQQKHREVAALDTKVHALEKYRDELSDTIKNIETVVIEISGARFVPEIFSLDSSKVLKKFGKYEKYVSKVADLAREGRTLINDHDVDGVLALCEQADTLRKTDLLPELQALGKRFSDAAKKIGEWSEYRDTADKREQQLHQQINEIIQKYPVSEGYPEPNPNIVIRLAELGEYLKQLQVVLTKSRELLAAMELDSFSSLCGSQQVKSLLEKEWLAELERMQKRAENTQTMAQFMHERRTQTRQVRQASRTLREHIVSLSQKLKAVEENIEVLQEKYPTGKGFPPPPIESGKLVEQTKERTGQLQSALQSIENTMLKDQLKEALQLSQPYIQLGKPDVAAMDDLHEGVRDVLAVCEKMAREQKARQQGMQILMEFDKTSEMLLQEFDNIGKGSKVLQKFPDELNVPRPDKDAASLLQTARTGLDNLQATLNKGREALYQNRFDEAVSLLQSLDRTKIQTSMANLRQLAENIQDAIQIAQGSEKRTRQSRDIAQLLQVTKEKLLPLDDLMQVVAQKNAVLRDTFPPNQGFPALDVAAYEVFQKASKVRNELKKTAAKVKTLLDNKEFDNALSLLQKQRSFVEEATQILPQIKEIENKLDATSEKCQSLSREKENLGEITRRSEQVAGYLKELEEHLIPLQTNLKDFAQNFPGQEGYPELPQQAQSTAENGGRIAQQLRDFLKQTLAARDKKDFAVAMEHLHAVATQRLLNRDLIADMSKYRYQVNDLVEESRGIKANRTKIAEIKELLAELQQRHDSFKTLLPTFTETLQTLKTNYPPEKGFFPYYRDADNIYKEGTIEMESLKQIIGDGEEYLHSGKYEKAADMLQPYSAKHGSSISKLALVQNIAQRLNDTLEKDRQLESDPKFREKFEAKLKAEETRKQLRLKWKRSPGPWFERLKKSLDEYERLLPRLASAVQDEGSNFLLSKLKGSYAEISDCPGKIADLEELIYNIESKGGKLEALIEEREARAVTQAQADQAVKLKRYLSKRQIEVENVEEECRKLENAVALLKKEMAQKPAVSKDTMKEVMKAFMSFESKYEDAYQPLHSVLTNFDASLQEKEKQ